jgi:hypothetical protein
MDLADNLMPDLTSKWTVDQDVLQHRSKPASQNQNLTFMGAQLFQASLQAALMVHP